jgi:hypothetical protein
MGKTRSICTVQLTLVLMVKSEALDSTQGNRRRFARAAGGFYNLRQRNRSVGGQTLGEPTLEPLLR